MSTVSESDCEKLQQVLDRWSAADAQFNAYHDDHDYLVLRIQPNATSQEQDFGLRLFYCTYIAGPTQWKDVQFKVTRFTYPDGEQGFEVQDSKVGFRIQCHGPIDIAGDPKQVFPRA
ncbi:MAG: hypothetical protein KF892_24150 [Rhizobacter sp.]|nr:hypothetical protein [Rhizobacter sp.]